MMAENAVPEIENPRRVLAVSLEGESHHLGRVVKGTSLSFSWRVLTCTVTRLVPYTGTCLSAPDEDSNITPAR